MSWVLERAFAPLRYCLPHCWRPDDDPERERLFPPPDTILTPPRRRRSPLPDLGQGVRTGSTSPAKGSVWGSIYESGDDLPRLRQESVERIGTISRAYAGRMQSIRTSVPSTPATPFSAHTHTTLPQSRSFHHPPHAHTTPASPDTPRRPAAPHLGRSVSEPELEHHFAHHQVASAGGVLRGRPRSMTAFNGLSPLASRSATPGEGGRRVSGGSQASAESEAMDQGVQGIRGRTRRSASISMLQSVLAQDASAPVEREVVKIDLGLHDLPGASRNRGRGRRMSRPFRGKRVTTS